MTSTQKEDLDLNFLNLAARKILENSGLTVSEAPDDAGQIHFLAATPDNSKTIGVCCSAEENAFSTEELEGIVAASKSVGCESLMIISSSTFSPEETEWASSNGVSLVDRARFLHTFEQLPDSVRAEIEGAASQATPAPEEATTENPEEEPKSEKGHHQPNPENQKSTKKKRWIPVLIILGALFIVLPVIGIVASIAIPTIMGLKSDAETLVLSGPRVAPPQAGTNPPIGSSPKASPSIAATKPKIEDIKPARPETAKTTAPSKPTAKPAPQVKSTAPSKPAAKPATQAKSTVPSKPTAKPAPQAKSTSPEKPASQPKPSPQPKSATENVAAAAPKEKPQDPLGLQLPQEAPVWKTTGQQEIREFLHDLWKFEKLADDPFFDLSEAILTQNVVKPGPLDSGTEIAMFVLPRKLEEYPELGCAALTILAPDDRSSFISKLEHQVRELNDPKLLLQLLAAKAETSQKPADVQEALDTLKTVLNPGDSKPLPDHLAFYLLSKSFVGNLSETAPDRFLTLVTGSPVVPGWLKDYLEGEKLWSNLNRDFQNQSFIPSEANESMQRIEERFESSWKANPRHPAAAARMIEVENVYPEKNLAQFRKWFDRSIKAQADYAPAYDNYLKVLATRETDSDRLGIKFGKSCAATLRFDTVVPLSLIDAHVLRCQVKNQSSAEYWSSLSDSDINDLRALFAGLNESDSLPHGGVTERSMEALFWFLTEDEEKAMQCLKDLGSSFDHNGFRGLNMKAGDQLKFREFLLEKGISLNL